MKRVLDIKVKLDIIEESMLCDWQKEVIDICNTEPHPRHIHWYWGGVGKSCLMKYILHHFGPKAVLLGGASSKNAICSIASSIKETGIHPEIVLINIYWNKVSYSILEEIKDGLMFSGKPDYRTILMNIPHVFILANYPPEAYEGLISDDKLQIHEIQSL